MRQLVVHFIQVCIRLPMTLHTRHEPGDHALDVVRRRLADVARVHPECRPSRGTLKQVFNRMFEMRR